MDSSVTVRVEIDERALREAISNGEGVESILQAETDKIVSRANSLSRGMRTGRWHDHSTGETLGDTEPEFAGNVKKRGKGHIGIVYTANYAAQKANMQSNILLKAKG